MVTQDLGIELCRVLYEKLNGCGFYPALTGGILYKDGVRKDIDIVIYRNRQQQKFELRDLEKHLSDCGLSEFKHFGFVTKAKWNGIVVDLFNPESAYNDDYPLVEVTVIGEA